MNLLRVVHPMLRVELRAALFRAAETSAHRGSLPHPSGDRRRSLSVDLRVSPAQDIAPDYLLVVISPRDATEGGVATAHQRRQRSPPCAIWSARSSR